MALKKPLNSFARARKVSHSAAKKQRQAAIAKLQQWAKGKSEELPTTSKFDLKNKTSIRTGFLFVFLTVALLSLKLPKERTLLLEYISKESHNFNHFGDWHFPWFLKSNTDERCATRYYA